MNYLLDTCVLSELTRKKPKTSVVNWMMKVREQDCFISILTFGEIQKGISKLPESSKKQKLQTKKNFC